MPEAATTGIRERVQAAASRIRRVKRLDRLATTSITLGGLLIIAGVSFIFLFILGETWPLFRPARGRVLDLVPLKPPQTTASGGAGAPTTTRHALVFGGDEYQMYVYALLPEARVAFFGARDGGFARAAEIASLAGATLSAASHSLQHDFVAAGTTDGRLALLQVRFRPKYEEQRLVDLDTEVRERGTFELDPERRPLRVVAYDEHEGRKAAAAVLASGELALVRVGDDDTARQSLLRVDAGEHVTALALARTSGLVAGTDRGRLYYWELDGEDARLTNRNGVAPAAITAVTVALGGGSILVGDARGGVSSVVRTRLHDGDTALGRVRTHAFEPQGAAIDALGASARGRSFATAAADGSLWLRHVTSERTLLRFPPAAQRLAGVQITPKMDAILGRLADGGLRRYEITNPHPEFSWRAVFGKVWYEGYPRPEYVWQSTGATDEFEPKLSLVPLVFGTIKGTLYALIFAVPIAILGALYTSQFMHPDLKARVKPMVEMMAALPSVVIGFVGGLWLASRVENDIVPVLLMVLLLPAVGTAGVLLWDRLPRRVAARLRPGMEIFLILPLMVGGGLLALEAGPRLELLAFGGDFKLWLSQALGLVYDQRNCVVVGIAMGFAVVPIIFTISEDAFSSVPSHLTAASLALGASRWQTATRVVLPTASPGLFSAVMVGFGRAVGETMIVLMATGNTPVMDWSVFNGMRTLSANIAVEVPEAPHGGTLYRILFLAAGVLFVMTFIVNTLAEVIRQRLRERYRAL